MAHKLLWVEFQRWKGQLSFSRAQKPKVPGSKIPRAFYGQEILSALFWDRWPFPMDHHGWVASPRNTSGYPGPGKSSWLQQQQTLSLPGR